MSDPAYSPGPWRRSEAFAAIEDSTGCTLFNSKHATDADEALAAAAPRMLMVSSVASNELHGLPKGQGPCLCSRCDLVREARVILARLPGDSSDPPA